MREDKFQALVDAARANDELLMAKLNTGLVTRVLTKFAHSGMSATDLITHARHGGSGDLRLTVVMVLMAERCQVPELIDAIINMPRDWWGEYFTAKSTGFMIGHFPSSGRALHEHINTLRDRTHPLYGCVPMSGYWTCRVMHYISKSDFVRAWSELRRALHGIPRALEDEEDFNVLKQNDALEYCLAADRLTVVSLAHLLYNAMALKGLIDRVPNTELTLTSEELEVEMVSYETRRSARRKPTTSKRKVPLAGLNEALAFRVQVGVSSQANSKKSPEVYTFEPIARILLAIAEYVRARRNDGRRQKFNTLLGEANTPGTTK